MTMKIYPQTIPTCSIVLNTKQKLKTNLVELHRTFIIPQQGNENGGRSEICPYLYLLWSSVRNFIALLNRIFPSNFVLVMLKMVEFRFQIFVLLNVPIKVAQVYETLAKAVFSIIRQRKMNVLFVSCACVIK